MKSIKLCAVISISVVCVAMLFGCGEKQDATNPKPSSGQNNAINMTAAESQCLGGLFGAMKLNRGKIPEVSPGVADFSPDGLNVMRKFQSNPAINKLIQQISPQLQTCATETTGDSTEARNESYNSCVMRNGTSASEKQFIKLFVTGYAQILAKGAWDDSTKLALTLVCHSS